MQERSGIITLKGNPMILLGNDVKEGELAPDFEVIDQALTPVLFSSFSGKVCIISSVPSLDTPICDMQTRRFNQEAINLGSDVVILTISVDLPFAQKRWCGAAGVDKVITLSDHRETNFGKAFGVLIKDVRLLARAIFVVDQKGIIQYRQIVSEVSSEPDYDSVLSSVKSLIN